MKKSALALIVCIAIGSARQISAADFNPMWAIPIYAFYLVNKCYLNEPSTEPVFKGDIKKALRPQLLSKQWWQNLNHLHDEWMVGQCYKERLVKVNKDMELKVSRKKCLPYGFTGKSLSYLAALSKARKTLVDVAFVAFAIAAIKNNSGLSEDFMKKFFNWKDAKNLLTP